MIVVVEWGKWVEWMVWIWGTPVMSCLSDLFFFFFPSLYQERVPFSSLFFTLPPTLLLVLSSHNYYRYLFIPFPHCSIDSRDHWIQSCRVQHIQCKAWSKVRCCRRTDSREREGIPLGNIHGCWHQTPSREFTFQYTRVIQRQEQQLTWATNDTVSVWYIASHQQGDHDVTCLYD